MAIIHLHHTELGFCGTQEQGRQFSFVENQISCPRCMAGGALVEVAQKFSAWHADRFEDFDAETSDELLQIANGAAYAIERAEALHS